MNTLPWIIEEPHWMRPNEDCMGNPTLPYWRVFSTHVPTKTVLIGFGQSEAEALASVEQKIAEQKKKWEAEL